jgi:hypothetical protein
MLPHREALTGVAMMKTINSAAMAFLVMFAAAPAFAQQTEEFFGNICEIDTSRLPLGNNPYVTPDGTQSVYTFNSHKLCTGVASKRNIKLECTTPLPDWGNRGDKSAKNFVCTINGDQCGLSPKAGDPNKPYLTATQSQLKVIGGIATLTCQYKP